MDGGFPRVRDDQLSLDAPECEPVASETLEVARVRGN